MRFDPSFSWSCSLLVHDAAWSQDAAPLTGHVVDPHGDGVPNAEVTLSAAGKSRSVVTAPDGGFSFDAVPVGSFVVQRFCRRLCTDNTNRSCPGCPGAADDRGCARRRARRRQRSRPGARHGCTGKTSLPLRDLPMTVERVSSQLVEEQGANDLVTALKNVPGVYAFTTYGVYEYYAFRGFLDAVRNGRRGPQRGKSRQHAADERRSRRSAEGAVVGVCTAAARLARRSTSSARSPRRCRPTISRRAREAGERGAAASAPVGGSARRRCTGSTSAANPQKAIATTTRHASR